MSLFRRQGRLRRWVVRPVFWLFAALALVALGTALFLESAFLERRVRLWLETRLTAALDRPVRVGSVELEPLPLSVVLGEVEIGDRLDGAPPFATVERLLVEARSVRWRDRRLTLGRVLIERPHVLLDYRPDGSNNLPRRRGGGGGGRMPLSLEVREFSIRDGTLELEQQRLPLSLDARELRATLLGGDGPTLAGRLDVQDVELVLPRARPFLGAVSMRVGLTGEGLEITQGRLRGPRLEADLDGEWLWREERQLNLDVRARADAGLFDALGYARGQLEGAFAFDGGVAWQPGVWGYRGRLSSDRAVVFGRRLLDLEAEVAGDRNGVRAQIARATYGGGALTGEVGLTQAEGRPFALRLEATDVSLARILADQGIPLEGVDGRVSGPFDYTFPVREPQRGSGRADLAIEPGTVGEAVQLAGRARLSFERGRLIAGPIQVASDAQHALVMGAYDIPRRDGRFEIEIVTERVEETLKLLPVAEETLMSAAWAPSSGSGQVEGSLIVAPEGVISQVRLDLTDVVAPGCRAERVRGTFQVGRHGLDGLRIEMSQRRGAVVVSGSIPFAAGKGPPFSLAVEAAGWPSADAQAWMPLELPLEGSLDGSLTLSGDFDRIVGDLRATLEPVDLAGVDLDRLDLDLGFDADQIRFREVTASGPAGRAFLEGSLGRETGALDLRLTADSLELAEAPFDGLGVGAAGRLAARAEIGGFWDVPTARGEISLASVSVEGASIETSSRLDFEWDGSRVELRGSLPGSVAIAGDGRLDAEGFDLSARVSSDELATLSSLLPSPRLAMDSGSFAGTLVARGVLDGSTSPELELELEHLVLARGDVRLRAAEPVLLRLDGESLGIESLFLETDAGESELFVSGSVDLGDGQHLDLRVQSSLESEWLTPILPAFAPRGGRFDLLASVEGTPSDPRVNGVGRLTGAEVLLDAPPIAVSELEGLVLFYPERLVLDSFRARAAGGTIEAGGSVVLGTTAPELRLDLVGEDLSFSYPEGWLLRGDARGSLVSNASGRTLRGEVELERAYYLEEVQVGFESALQGLFGRRRVTSQNVSEALAATSLNLKVEGADALRIRNDLADLSGDVDLTLRGTLAFPVLFGEIELTPGGTLVYAGNDYEIERGSLNFANPYRIEPIVDLSARADLRDYDVRLELSGSPERLDVGVSSDPPLPDLEVLALLTGSRSAASDSFDASSEDDAGLGVEGFLAGEAASVVTNRVNRLFGLDRLRVSPLTGTSGDLSSARVTLGERISRDLFATYSYDPSTSEQQILELEWSVSSSLVVVFTQNGDEGYSVDLRWEKVF